MFEKDKERLQIDLYEVKELTLVSDGYLLIAGKNCKVEIGFYHVEFKSIELTIKDPRLSKMSVSSFVYGVTDDKLLIEIRELDNRGRVKEFNQSISETKEQRRRLAIDLRIVAELDLENSGTVRISGENSLLTLGFHEGDFTFIKFTIKNTDLNRMHVSDVVDGRIAILVLEAKCNYCGSTVRASFERV